MDPDKGGLGKEPRHASLRDGGCEMRSIAEGRLPVYMISHRNANDFMLCTDKTDVFHNWGVGGKRRKIVYKLF